MSGFEDRECFAIAARCAEPISSAADLISRLMSDCGAAPRGPRAPAVPPTREREGTGTVVNASQGQGWSDAAFKRLE